MKNRNWTSILVWKFVWHKLNKTFDFHYCNFNYTKCNSSFEILSTYFCIRVTLLLTKWNWSIFEKLFKNFWKTFDNWIFRTLVAFLQNNYIKPIFFFFSLKLIKTIILYFFSIKSYSFERILLIIITLFFLK